MALEMQGLPAPVDWSNECVMFGIARPEFSIDDQHLDPRRPLVQLTSVAAIYGSGRS